MHIKHASSVGAVPDTPATPGPAGGSVVAQVQMPAKRAASIAVPSPINHATPRTKEFPCSP